LDEIPEEVEDTLGALASVNLRLTEIGRMLDELVNHPAHDKVYWAEQLPNSYRLTLQAAPLHIGPLMEQYLWHEKSSVILTSATLTTNNEFDYIR